ncbi:hypothetical protein PHAVU_L001641 [Phaseolus vulgaris]|uniref:Uncharacterized protein n=1 Tax=Phaseolus vulgaris TaxID=3885 RepID=A0ACC3NZW1_PHAVU
MKRMDIFCASQASTAICLSMDQASCSSSSNTILLGGRVIDRHNPIIMTQEGALPNLSLPHVPPLTHPSTPSLTMSSTSPRKTLLPKLQQRVLKITGRRTHHRISLNMSPTLLNQLTALWVGVCLSQLLI